MAKMDLTKLERALLENQYKILEKMDPDNAERYRTNQEILHRGFSILYDDVVDCWDGLTYDECRFVYDILDVYRVLKHDYEALLDKSGIDPDDIKFEGFDGNNESRFMGFAEFLKVQGRWQETLPTYLNTHYPTLDTYEGMIQRFEAIRERSGHSLPGRDLTREEILEVIG